MKSLILFPFLILPLIGCSSSTPKAYLVGDPIIKNKDEMASVFISDPEQKWIIADFIKDGTIFKKYNFNYESIDINNNKIILSGAMTIPYRDNKPTAWGMVVNSHPTLSDRKDAPSKTWDEFTIPVIDDCIVLECDLLGLGVTENSVAVYHCQHLSVPQTIDGINGAFELLDSKLGINSKNLKLFNVGYSQGAFDAMALLRYLETNKNAQNSNNISFAESFFGSGAYNMKLVVDENIDHPESYHFPEYTLLGLICSKEYHPNFFEGINIHDYLTEVGEEMYEPVKNRDKEAVNRIKDRYPDYNFKTIFADNYFDKTSPLYNALSEAFKLENLIDGNWIPKGKVQMVYTLKDEVVNPQCSIAARELFKNHDNITFVSYNDEKCTHRSTGVIFYIKVFATIRHYRP